MTDAEHVKRARRRPGLLVGELASFIHLRWAAGGAVLAGAPAARQGWAWAGGSDSAPRLAFLGALILAYNAVLWFILRRFNRVAAGQRAARPRTRRNLLPLVWVQMLLDLTCLTYLTLLTGGVASPLRGFFIFHMVFASLLLPRLMAYAGAGAAMLLMAAGLWLTGRWPATSLDTASMLAWVVMLLVTVWLANGITRRVRRQRRRLVRQNRRIRAMARTLERQQAALVQQEKMAVAGRMAAGVAHEVANPLASMDGLLQLIERRPERLRPESVATLREQVARISQIVRRMTGFAHPGAGDWHEQSLNDVVGRALEVLRFDPRIKRMTIDCQLAPDLPPVRMQPEAIQQVVVNLVVNAADAMEQVAEPRLTVRTFRDGGGSWCAFEIADNGHGIAPAHRDRLFEPFFTTKPVGKGTGLGLSISYTLVRSHQGEILVESTPGRGTRFTVRLPATAAAPGGTGHAGDGRRAIASATSGTDR